MPGGIFKISPGFFVRHKPVVPKLNNLSIFKAENVIEGSMLAGSQFLRFYTRSGTILRIFLIFVPYRV